MLKAIRKTNAYEKWICNLIEKMTNFESKDRITKEGAFNEVYQQLKGQIEKKFEEGKQTEKEIEDLKERIRRLEEKKATQKGEIDMLFSELEQVRKIELKEKCSSLR